MKLCLLVLLTLSGLLGACATGGAPRPAPAVISSEEASTDAIPVVQSDYRFEVGRLKTRQGLVDFAIKNLGVEHHEFVVVPFADGRYGLPVGEHEALETGEGGVLRLSLSPGHYRLVCLLVSTKYERPTSHLDLGMNVDFEVTS